MKIVLDSNIFCSDYHLEGQTFRIFLDGLSHTKFGLFVPPIVLEETVNRHREDVQKTVGKLRNSERELGRLLSRSLFPVLSQEQIQEENERYKKLLLGKLKAAHATILPYPNISHEEVVKRDLARRKPFRQSGVGYRDCLIWESIVSLALGCDEAIVFITNNIKDFAEGSTIHEELQEDLQSRGIDRDRIHLYRSLEEFNKALIVPRLQSVDEMRDKFQKGEIKEFNVADWVRSNLLDIHGPEDIAAVGLGVPRRGFSVRMIKIQYDQPLIKQVRLLGSGDVLLAAEVNIKARIAVSSAGEEYLTEPGVQAFWSNRPELSSSLSFEDTCEARSEFELILQKNTYEVLSAKADSLSGSYWRDGWLISNVTMSARKLPDWFNKKTDPSG